MPEKWDSKSVKALGEIKLGRQSAPKYRVGDSIRPQFRVVNISNDRLDLRDVKLMDFPGDDANRYALEPGDVLLTEGDLVSANNVGRSAIYRGEIAGCCFQNTLLRFRPNELVTSEFAHYGFCFLRRQGRFAEPARATTVFHLSAGRFQDVELPVPPLPEQRKIAAILSSVDDTIEKTEAVIDQLEVVKKGLLGELLTRGMPGRHRDFLETRAGTIPAGWSLSTVGAAGEWSSGGTPSKAETSFWMGTVPWVSPKDMKRLRLADSIDHVSKAALENGTRLVPEGTIFIVVRGMILAHSFPIALTERPMAFNQDMKALRPASHLDPEFLLYWLVSVRDKILSLVADSSHGTKRLPTEQFYAMPLPVPPLPEQREIAAGLRALDSTIEKHRRSAQLARELKVGLLDLLLSGRVRVSGNELEAA